MKLNLKEYKELFKFEDRITCLHSEFLVKSRLSIGWPLVVCKDKNWKSYINRNKERRCLQKGLKIFSSEKLYERYKKDFLEYLNMANEEIVPLSRKNNKLIMEKNDLRDLLLKIGKFWDFYSITEFSFHDLAYKKFLETNDKTLRKNLDNLGKLKFKGRKLLNAYVFKGGVIHNLLNQIGDNFCYHESDTQFMFSNEIFELFDGKELPRKIIEQRKKYYGCISKDDKFKIFSFEEARDTWEALLEEKGIKKEIKELRGATANRGIKSGRAIIAPMLTNMGKVSEINTKMKEGDILIAESTSPELMVLCKKAAAIVADQGGMLSHAAIISRELGIPCIIGTKIATQVLKDGDLVEVDAEKGVVKILKKIDEA